MDKYLEKTWQEKEIIRRSDGSYVIDTGMPYHVPNSSEWKSLWDEVHTFANEYPEKITVVVETGPTLDEARAAKLAEIVAAANTVKAALSSRYSALEESTWPEQEAGARAVLNDAANVKDTTARLILLDAAGTAAAVALVESLATADGAAREDFARRITANADAAHAAGIAALLEQRGMEAAVRNAASVEDVRGVTVLFSVAASA